MSRLWKLASITLEGEYTNKMKALIEKLKEEAWYNRIDDKFGESLQEDCVDFIEKLLLEEQKKYDK